MVSIYEHFYGYKYTVLVARRETMAKTIFRSGPPDYSCTTGRCPGLHSATEHRDQAWPTRRTPFGAIVRLHAPLIAPPTTNTRGLSRALHCPDSCARNILEQLIPENPAAGGAKKRKVGALDEEGGSWQQIVDDAKVARQERDSTRAQLGASADQLAKVRGRLNAPLANLRH